MTKSAQRLALVSALLIGAPAFAQTTATTTEMPAWLNRVSLGGDFRFRFAQESVPGAQDTSEVIRARLALVAKVNDSITANFRLATAGTSNTITSSNVDLSGFGAKKNVWFDIASVDWKAFDGVTLTAGKAVNPFFSAGKNELIWDGDLTFEGVNAKYAQDFGAFQPFAAVAHNQINETTGTSSAPDVTLLGAQIGVGYKSEPVNAVLAVSSYTYNNLKGFTAISAKGNSLTGGAYDFEYKLTNVELEVSSDAAGIPLMGYGAWVQNSDPSDNKDGWLAGLRIGKVKDVYSWALDYNYREVKADATLGLVNDSDFAGGGTNVKGHKIAAQFVVMDGTTLSATAFFDKQNIATSETFYEKYLLEAVTTF